MCVTEFVYFWILHGQIHTTTITKLQSILINKYSWWAIFSWVENAYRNLKTNYGSYYIVSITILWSLHTEGKIPYHSETNRYLDTVPRAKHLINMNAFRRGLDSVLFCILLMLQIHQWLRYSFPHMLQLKFGILH